MYTTPELIFDADVTKYERVKIKEALDAWMGQINAGNVTPGHIPQSITIHGTSHPDYPFPAYFASAGPRFKSVDGKLVFENGKPVTLGEMWLGPWVSKTTIIHELGHIFMEKYSIKNGVASWSSVEHDSTWANATAKVMEAELGFVVDPQVLFAKDVACFPAGTLITLADGTTKVIEDIAVGDVVMSFGADGVLRPAPVTQLLDNVTTEWLKLSNGTVVTPGHRYLRPDGSFMEIKEIIAGDGRIVTEAGQVMTVTAEAIHYSTDTAHMFEQHEKLVSATSGATALAPEVKTGWRTYNFTVGGTHTYIADGVRVHNDSILSTLEEGDVLVALNDDLTDAAVLRDVNGDGVQDFVTLDGYRRDGEATNVALERVSYWDAANGDLAEKLAAVMDKNSESYGNVFDPGNGNTWNNGAWGDDVEEAYFDDVYGDSTNDGTDRNVVDGLYDVIYYNGQVVTDIVNGGLTGAALIVASDDLIAAIGEDATSSADAKAIVAWMVGIEEGSLAYLSLMAALGSIFDFVDEQSDGIVKGTDGDDVIDGGYEDSDGDVVTSGDDDIRGFGGDDRLYGLGGNDKLYGGDGNDRLYSGAGDDKLYGGDGNDYFLAGGGVESFYGGSGRDYISYYKSTGGVTLDLENNTASGSWASNDTIHGFEGASGSKTGDDKIYGTSGANTIKTYGGDDKIYGREGSDRLYGGDGHDRLYGGDGNDRLYGGDGNDYLRDDDGHTRFVGGEGSDTASYYGSSTGIEANLSTGENNMNSGYDGIENLMGSKTANDRLTGDDGANKLYGVGGDDRLYGLDGNDKLYGGDGNDRLYGGAGYDKLYGGAGNDKLRSGHGKDKLYGGDGNDFLGDWSGFSELYGGSGDDRLYGGAGGDKLYGGAGNDRLYGGAGNDTFQFVSGDGVDTIYDFEDGIDTLIIGSGKQYSDLTISSVSNGVLVDYGSGDSILLKDASLSDITQDDFLFL